VYAGTLTCNKHAQLLLASIGFVKCVRDTLILKMCVVSEGKGKAVPLQAWRGFQEVQVPRFHDNGTGWW